MKASNAIAGSGWILVILWVAYEALAPAWFWVDYRGLKISDGIVGGLAPAVTQDIVYQKPLLIHWDRTLLMREVGDDWVPVCYSEGAGGRYPGFVNGAATLEAFFDGRACARRLQTGEYFVEDDVEWNDLVARNVGVESNTFEIGEPEPMRTPRLQPPAGAPRTRHVHVRPRPRAPWPFSIFIH